MRTVLFLFFVFPLVLKGQEKYRIVGDIQQLKEYDMIYLEYGFWDNQKVDSTQIIDGKFEFQGEVSEPTYATLNLRNGNRDVQGPTYMELYLSKGEIRIVADKLDTKVLVGNELNESFARYTKGIDPIQAWRRKEGVFLDMGKLFEGLDAEKVYDYNFLNSNPLNYHSLQLIAVLLNNANVMEMEEKYKALLPLYGETKIGLTLGKRIEKYKKVAIGARALDFKMLDTGGNSLRLSDLKGKNILLNFWSSYENSSREKFKELHDVLNEQKYDNLIILHIDIPFDGAKAKERWLKTINLDKLTDFKHVTVDAENRKFLFDNYSTTNGGPSIDEVFDNYLLNEDGLIVNSFIRAHNIQDKLSMLQTEN